MRPQVLCLHLSVFVFLQLHNVLSKNIYGLVEYGQRSVSDRLQSLGRSVDVDKNSVISPNELVDWARTLGRPDDDDSPDTEELSCVMQDEFEAGIVKAGFSHEFAASYTNFLKDHSISSPPATCTGLDTQAILDEAAKGNYDDEALSDFLDGFLLKLTDFCEDTSGAHTGEDLYNNNKDCVSLPTACASVPYGCEPVCLQYTFVTTAGRRSGAFSERSSHQAAATATSDAPQQFAQKIISSFQDPDGDGVFSKDEQTQDFKANFDTNSDGCVDEAEYKARMSTSLCGGFAFSNAFATAKFNKLKGTSASTGGGGAAQSSGSGGAAQSSGSGGAAQSSGSGGAAQSSGSGGAAQSSGSGGAAQSSGSGGAAQSSGSGGAAQSSGSGGAAQSSGSGGAAQSTAGGGAAQTTGSGGSDTCKGIDVNLPSATALSRASFINEDVQTLIDLCEGDKSLYDTNEDCKQLSLTCRVEASTRNTDACKKYVQDTDSNASKNDQPVQDVSVKFFKFLSKWGGSYEDYFGPKRTKLNQ